MPKGGCRNKKPTVLKVLQGTARPDRIKKGEPKPAPVAPPPPAWLDRRARATWRKYAPMLERLGLLTEADGESFAAYCQAVSRYVTAVKRLKKVGREAPDDIELIRKAEVSVEKAEQSMRLLGNEFGLTPAARSRIDVAPEASDAGESILEKMWQR
jgi:P27 family predicted phage terminase small subunit